MSIAKLTMSVDRMDSVQNESGHGDGDEVGMKAMGVLQI